MLPIFIKMGFRENDFITDYGVNKMDEQDIEILKNNFCIKSSFGDSYFNKIYVDCYIGKYFAIKACPNNSFDYSSGLCALKSINPQLYSILDSFMTEWINFNINDANPTTGGYFSMEYDFTKGLENWILSNRIR